MKKLTNEDLIAFAKFDNAEDLQKAISAGLDVNTPDKWGNTALTYASLQDNTECIRLLIDNGARLDHKDIYGCTIPQLVKQIGIKDRTGARKPKTEDK